MNVLYLHFFLLLFFYRMSRPGMVASIHVSLKTDMERLVPLGSFKSEVSHCKCSKISNTSCLPKRPRQTMQTQIRLFLRKQSDQPRQDLLFARLTSILRISSLITNILFENRKRKLFKNLEHLQYCLIENKIVHSLTLYL